MSYQQYINANKSMTNMELIVTLKNEILCDNFNCINNYFIVNYLTRNNLNYTHSHLQIIR